MGIKTGVEAADIGCCDHIIIREAVPVCRNSLREKGPPQFYPGEGCKDFLAVTPRLRVCCHSELGILDLVNATDVLVSINENTPSSSVFHGRKSEKFQSVGFVFDVTQQSYSTSLNTFNVFVYTVFCDEAARWSGRTIVCFI